MCLSLSTGEVQVHTSIWAASSRSRAWYHVVMEKDGLCATPGQCAQLLLYVWVRWGSSGNMLVQVFFCPCPVESESRGCIGLQEGIPSGVSRPFVPAESTLCLAAVLSRVPALLFTAVTGFGIGLDRCRKLSFPFSTICPGMGAGTECVKIFKHLAPTDYIGHQAPKYTHGPGHNSLNPFKEDSNILEYCMHLNTLVSDWLQSEYVHLQRIPHATLLYRAERQYKLRIILLLKTITQILF